MTSENLSQNEVPSQRFRRKTYVLQFFTIVHMFSQGTRCSKPLVVYGLSGKPLRIKLNGVISEIFQDVSSFVGKWVVKCLCKLGSCMGLWNSFVSTVSSPCPVRIDSSTIISPYLRSCGTIYYKSTHHTSP